MSPYIFITLEKVYSTKKVVTASSVGQFISNNSVSFCQSFSLICQSLFLIRMNREISYTVYCSASLFPQLCCEATLGPETC